KSAPVDLPTERDARLGPKTEAARRPRAVRSRHAVFRHENPARPIAGLRFARAREVLGVSGRTHVLLARRFAPGFSSRGRGADEVRARSKRKPTQTLGICAGHFVPPNSVNEAGAGRFFESCGER